MQLLTGEMVRLQPNLRRARGLLTMIVLTGTAPLHASEGTATDPFAVVAEADRLAAKELWPGFNPQEIPLAIYDGQRTLLFRHSAPPEAFEPVPGRDGVWVFIGRHPSVVAESVAELGGVRTATLMPPIGAVPLRSRAAALLHEAFHVFERKRHPAWGPNVMELFTYPVDDAELLGLRRLETHALRRALASSGQRSSRTTRACWTFSSPPHWRPARAVPPRVP